MKKIIRISGAIASLILILSLSGCYYNEVIEDITPPVENVSFATEIQPIFNANCTACHPTVAQPDLTEGNSYDGLISIPGAIIPGDAEGSELMDMLRHDPAADNPMPPQGPMSSTNINLIRDWINQGALNN